MIEKINDTDIAMVLCPNTIDDTLKSIVIAMEKINEITDYVNQNAKDIITHNDIMKEALELLKKTVYR